MKPEDITVDLETAKKLKEAGWEKPTYFEWSRAQINGKWQDKWFLDKSITNDSPYEVEEYFTPTAEEVLRELPARIKGVNLFTKNMGAGTWEVMYFKDGEDDWLDDLYFKDKSIANAAAKMWVFLKKNNLLK